MQQPKHILLYRYLCDSMKLMGTAAIGSIFFPPLHAAQVNYEGPLSDGIAENGAISGFTLPNESSSDFSDYWYFYGNAGDVISLSVARLEPEFDPHLWLFEGHIKNDTHFSGSIDRNDPGYLDEADDENPPGTGSGPWGDPLTSVVLTLPGTGIYTAIVTSFGSGVNNDDVWAYTIIANNILNESNGSIRVSPINAISSIRTSHTTNSQISFENQEYIIDDIPTHFSIDSGPNIGNRLTTSSNQRGEAQYSWMGINGAGTDTLSVCFTDLLGEEHCSEAKQTWVDTPPSISGTPPDYVEICQIFESNDDLTEDSIQFCNYRFSPTISDEEKQILTCTIEHKPLWASFNIQTCELDGLPAQDDIGIYENITICVSDGDNLSCLPPFDITIEGKNRKPRFEPGLNIKACKNAGNQAITEFIPEITDGNANTQQLLFHTTNDNPELFGGLLNAGGQPTISASSNTLYFRGRLDKSGVANVCTRLEDNGREGNNLSNEECFTIEIDDSCDQGASEIFGSTGSPFPTDDMFSYENFVFGFANFPGMGESDNKNQSDLKVALRHSPINHNLLGTDATFPTDEAGTNTPTRNQGPINPNFSAIINNNGPDLSLNVSLHLKFENHKDITILNNNCDGESKTGNYTCHYPSLKTGNTAVDFLVEEQPNREIKVIADISASNDSDYRDNTAKLGYKEHTLPVKKMIGGGSISLLSLFFLFISRKNMDFGKARIYHTTTAASKKTKHADIS